MIYTLGESLMDVIKMPNGKTVSKPGGSLLNVSVSLGRSGKVVSLISEIGDDETGNQLIEFLHINGINTDYVTIYKNVQLQKPWPVWIKTPNPVTLFKKLIRLSARFFPPVFKKVICSYWAPCIPVIR